MSKATVARTADEAIASAAEVIKTSDRTLRLAADYLAFAEAKGATQREMAEGIGRSAAWVNCLLQWRRNGYSESTPFGAQSRERDKRHDERTREREHARTRSGPKHDDGIKQRRERARRDKARAYEARVEAEVRARMAEAFGRAAQLDEVTRRRLVGCLGLLGSDKDGEVLNAARKVEKTRQRLNLN